MSTRLKIAINTHELELIFDRKALEFDSKH
jgi:hypothetical protein